MELPILILLFIIFVIVLLFICLIFLLLPLIIFLYLRLTAVMWSRAHVLFFKTEKRQKEGFPSTPTRLLPVLGGKVSKPQTSEIPESPIVLENIWHSIGNMYWQTDMCWACWIKVHRAELLTQSLISWDLYQENFDKLGQMFDIYLVNRDLLPVV